MEGKQMTEEWKQLGFIVKESEKIYSVHKANENYLFGIAFHTNDNKITYQLVDVKEEDYKDMIERTVEYLQDKNDLIYVMGNEWKHLKNHANKVNGK
jgi:hypothetical protein